MWDLKMLILIKYIPFMCELIFDVMSVCRFIIDNLSVLCIKSSLNIYVFVCYLTSTLIKLVLYRVLSCLVLSVIYCCCCLD